MFKKLIENIVKRLLPLTVNGITIDIKDGNIHVSNIGILALDYERAYLGKYRDLSLEEIEAKISQGIEKQKEGLAKQRQKIMVKRDWCLPDKVIVPHKMYWHKKLIDVPCLGYVYCNFFDDQRPALLLLNHQLEEAIFSKRLELSCHFTGNNGKRISGVASIDIDEKQLEAVKIEVSNYDPNSSYGILVKPNYRHRYIAESGVHIIPFDFLGLANNSQYTLQNQEESRIIISNFAYNG